MTISEILLQDFNNEILNTRRTLERVPAALAEYKPHEKSMAMGKLAMHCATLPLFGSYIIDDPGMDMAAPLHPHIPLKFESPEACLAQLEESAEKCRAALTAASDEHMSAFWCFSFGDQLISREPRSKTFRTMCFNHMIHHVAQLGVYLRLNGIPVPALYGPSADEQWSSQ